MAKEKIISILKESEQRDHKRGGVFIAPEMYHAIADKIYRDLLMQKKNAPKCKCIRYVGGNKWHSNGCEIHPDEC